MTVTEYKDNTKTVDIIKQQLNDFTKASNEAELLEHENHQFNDTLDRKAFKFGATIGGVTTVVGLSLALFFLNMSVGELIMLSGLSMLVVSILSGIGYIVENSKPTQGMFDYIHISMENESTIKQLQYELIEEQLNMEIVSVKRISENADRMILGNDKHEAYSYIVSWNSVTDFSYYREMDAKKNK